MASRLSHSRHFLISKYFSAQAPGYGVFLPIVALLIPGWIDSRFKGLTSLERQGTRSTDSVVDGAALGKRFLRFLAWVAGLAFTALGTIAPAAAADLPAFPVKAPPVAGLYDWTGFYVGGHLGYAGGNSNWTANPTLNDFSISLEAVEPSETATVIVQ